MDDDDESWRHDYPEKAVELEIDYLKRAVVALTTGENFDGFKEWTESEEGRRVLLQKFTDSISKWEAELDRRITRH